MRPVWTVLLYVTGVFAAGALFAPWWSRITQALAPRASVFHDLAQQPFQRFVIRSILGFALLGLLPVARYSGIRSWREVGLWWERRSLRELGAGAFVGFASLALIAFFALLFGARNWNPSMANRHLGESILRALIAACAVAVLEEILFRGVLFGVLRRG